VTGWGLNINPGGRLGFEY